MPPNNIFFTYFFSNHSCSFVDIYILLDILVCSIAVYFYESRSILASPKGESKNKC